MNTIAVNDLVKGRQYHIFNGFATTLDEMWLNDTTLINIDSEWSKPTILEFQLPCGKRIVLDSDFIVHGKFDKTLKQRWQIFQKSQSN